MPPKTLLDMRRKKYVLPVDKTKRGNQRVLTPQKIHFTTPYITLSITTGVFPTPPFTIGHTTIPHKLVHLTVPYCHSPTNSPLRKKCNNCKHLPKKLIINLIQ